MENNNKSTEKKRYLRRIYLPEIITTERLKFFTNYKLPILEKFNDGKAVKTSFDIVNAAQFVRSMQTLAKGNNRIIIRIGTQTQGKSDFVLLFCSADKDGKPIKGSAPLMLNDKGTFQSINEATAEIYATNYTGTESDPSPLKMALDQSVDCVESAIDCEKKETTELFLPKKTINALLVETAHYINEGQITGIRFYFTSYADWLTEWSMRDSQQKFLQRLTLQLSYVKDNQPVGLSHADRDRLKEELTGKDKISDPSEPVDGLNSIVPIPPPLEPGDPDEEEPPLPLLPAL